MLVLAPTGRDAEMICDRLATSGMECEICAGADELLAGIASGVGTAVIAQEALSPAHAEALVAALDAQEPWSDLPVLLLVAESRARGRSRPTQLEVPAVFERANVTLLQRPLGIRLFLSNVRSALRARQRQYQVRELNRELERAVQLSDLFVGILGHDLRNPIGAIRLSAENIVRTSSDTHALRSAGRVLTSADRVTRMIEQLLDFARARGGGGIPLRMQHLNLGEQCRLTVQELEAANPDAVVDFHEAGNLAGVWDGDRLAQVVSNLVGNAVKHGTRDEPITVDVDGTSASVVRLRVQNAGTIPAGGRETLFEAFNHAGAGSRRTGLGLGLFIARQIVRAHGGDIEVQSTDRRTTFMVVLPREAQPVDTGGLTAS